MFKQFLNGFISLFPFFYRNNSKIKYYPEYIYVNDWKIIGNLLGTKARNKIRGVQKNDQ